MHDTLLEISLRGIRQKNDLLEVVGSRLPKKRRLEPQNDFGILGPEKLLKIVNCATIKRIGKIERNNGGGPSGIGRWPPISTWNNVSI